MTTEKLTISSNIDKKATEFANSQVKNDLKKDCFEYLKRHFKHHFEDGNKFYNMANKQQLVEALLFIIGFASIGILLFLIRNI
jgi:RNA binding exosome subunit